MGTKLSPLNQPLMKIIIKPLLLTFIFMPFFMSCNNDELQTDDPVKESIKEPTDQPEGNEITTPCGFDLSKVQANQTIVINCLLDLGGDTVNLPANVKLLYEGGDIINGTLNFSTNNSISGQLLSASLNLTGSIPLIKDPVFEFKPQRWGIVQFF